MMGAVFGTSVLTSIAVRPIAVIRVLCIVMKVVKVIRVVRVLILGIYRKTVMHMCF
jgi:hypothetical protein